MSTIFRSLRTLFLPALSPRIICSPKSFLSASVLVAFSLVLSDLVFANGYVPGTLGLSTSAEAAGPDGTETDSTSLNPASSPGNHTIQSAAQSKQAIDIFTAGTESKSRIESVINGSTVTFSSELDFEIDGAFDFRSSASAQATFDFMLEHTSRLTFDVAGVGINRILGFSLIGQDAQPIVRVDVPEFDIGVIMNNVLVADGLPFQTEWVLGPGPYSLTYGHGTVPVLGTAGPSVGRLLVDFSILGDFNFNDVLDADDIDALTTAMISNQNEPQFDLNQDSQVDSTDRRIWVEGLAYTYFGDSNLDGEFNATDLIAVFIAAEFDDAIPGNSSWAEGDWNGDRDFDSSDLVVAFQSNGFEKGPRRSSAESFAHQVPESSYLGCWLLSFAFFHLRARTHSRNATFEPEAGSRTSRPQRHAEN